MKKLVLLTLTMLGTLALLALTWQLRNVVGILLVAILLATTMSGFVAGLANRGWSARIARITVIVSTLVFIGLFVVLSIYTVGERLPQALNDFRTVYGEMRASLVSGNRAEAAIAMRMPSPTLLDDLLLGADGSGLLTIFSGISSTFGVITSNIVLIIFVALYWVVDRERIEQLWLSLLSPRHRSHARNLLYKIEDEIGSYLRSEIVQYVISLPLLIIGYMLIGLKYPILMAWLVSIFWFVPLIGAFLALIPALLLGLIDGYWVALGTLVYTLTMLVIVPKLVYRYPSLRQREGSIIGLIITIALVDGMGIFGLLVAMPMTVAIQVLISSFLNAETAQTADSPQLQVESLLNNLTTIQNKIADGSETISPRTASMFQRLDEMVADAGIKE